MNSIKKKKQNSNLNEVIVFSSTTADEVTAPCNRLRSLDQAKVRI